MLLSFADYQKLGGTAPTDKYPKLEQDAEDLINPITNDYYVLHSIDNDEDKYRVQCFKKALELQINLTHHYPAATPHGIPAQDINSGPADGTTVTKGTTPTNFVTNGVYNLARDYLYRGGFLFRGIPHA